jgi:hypothetical protein
MSIYHNEKPACEIIAYAFYSTDEKADSDIDAIVTHEKGPLIMAKNKQNRKHDSSLQSCGQGEIFSEASVLTNQTGFLI